MIEARHTRPIKCPAHPSEYLIWDGSASAFVCDREHSYVLVRMCKGTKARSCTKPIAKGAEHDRCDRCEADAVEAY